VVQRFLGKRLTRLSRAEFISDGSGSGPLEFEFEDGSRLVLDLVVDGESVSVSTQGLDFQSHDTWVRRDLEAPDLIGSRLTRLDALSCTRFRGHHPKLIASVPRTGLG
jgi:hypothetical protein